MQWCMHGEIAKSERCGCVLVGVGVGVSVGCSSGLNALNKTKSPERQQGRYSNTQPY